MADSTTTPDFLTNAEWNYLVGVLKLNAQQVRIVSLILQGKQDKEICRELGLARPTVRVYLRRLGDRVGVDSRTELILFIFSVYARQKQRAETSAV